MATGNPQATGDFVTQAILDRKDELAWWKRYKGTIITAVAAVAAVATTLIDSGLDLPTWALSVSVAVIGVANTLGVRYYKPEPTSKNVDMVQQAIAMKIDNAHGISEQN